MKFNDNGKERVIFLYQNEFTTLNDHQRAGLLDLLVAINADDLVTDYRHVAYMLATVKHETADTFLPIAEYGKGKGHKYGLVDSATGQAYYGRGYVQLTWLENYRSMGVALDVDLRLNPDLAMQPDIAYQIMSRGMRKGSFTGVGLKNYINDQQCDYRLARKIINGLDCADRIAGYAEKFESILKECVVPG
jgi:hypothetical protein